MCTTGREILIKGSLRISVYNKRRTKKIKLLLTLGGTRTRNPRFRRPMPYPLGHEGDRLIVTRVRISKRPDIRDVYHLREILIKVQIVTRVRISKGLTFEMCTTGREILIKGNLRISVYNKNVQKKKLLFTLGGSRTRNPRFRRPMPYPLGHEGDRLIVTRVRISKGLTFEMCTTGREILIKDRDACSYFKRPDIRDVYRWEEILRKVHIVTRVRISKGLTFEMCTTGREILIKGNLRISVYNKRRAKKKLLLTLGGTRTRNPRFRRPMPYPLGHEGDSADRDTCSYFKRPDIRDVYHWEEILIKDRDACSYFKRPDIRDVYHWGEILIKDRDACSYFKRPDIRDVYHWERNTN
ncbi:hypothetical protein CEXT_480121 [Caerostris extrusa]|uniref:Ribosomal protein S4 n=1 Tax=Caerostris extrusa TaxID=172846 RepID=A0AAV4XPM5_CAEEX|nr:hypothetical protein CEXT_480121 [Caerostris extrusa]